MYVVCVGGGERCGVSGSSISCKRRMRQEIKFLLKCWKLLTNHNKTYAGFSGNVCNEEREFSEKSLQQKSRYTQQVAFICQKFGHNY